MHSKPHSAAEEQALSADIYAKCTKTKTKKSIPSKTNPTQQIISDLPSYNMQNLIHTAPQLLHTHMSVLNTNS